MAALTIDSRRARALLQHLVKYGQRVARNRKNIADKRVIDSLVRKGLAVFEAKPDRVVLRVTDAGRTEVKSW